MYEMINTELPKTNGKCEPFPTTQRKSVHPLTMIVSMCVCVRVHTHVCYYGKMSI